MAVNQDLLSNTKHVQEQQGAITLTLFRPPRDIDKTTTTKGWRFVLMLSWASRHIGVSRQGHHGTPMPEDCAEKESVHPEE